MSSSKEVFTQMLKQRVTRRLREELNRELMKLFEDSILDEDKLNILLIKFKDDIKNYYNELWIKNIIE